MIFDFSYKTAIVDPEEIIFREELNIAPMFGGGLTLSSDLLSGVNSTHLSVNGQSFAEQSATEEFVGPFINYQNSGDYYFKHNSTFRMVSWAQNLESTLLPKSSFLYHVKESSVEIPIGSGSTVAEIQSGLNASIVSKFPEKYSASGLDSFEYFLNGQKIYSGSGFYELSDSGFLYNGDITGKIFAMPKRSGVVSSTGVVSDRSGQNFIESSVLSYHNGVAVGKNMWLELDESVNILQLGYSAKITENPIGGSTSVNL